MTKLGAMLDTNIVSELIRAPHGIVYGRLREFGAERVCISIVVASELRYGAEKRRSPRLTGAVSEILSGVSVLPFEAPADVVYGQIRAELTRIGKPIGPLDFLIAAHALALDLMLVTANVAEFSRVPGLRVENWLD